MFTPKSPKTKDHVPGLDLNVHTEGGARASHASDHNAVVLVNNEMMREARERRGKQRQDKENEMKKAVNKGKADDLVSAQWRRRAAVGHRDAFSTEVPPQLLG